MKSLINAGKYEIITPKEQLLYQLINIEHAGRVAYQSETKPVTLETAKDFIANNFPAGKHWKLKTFVTCISAVTDLR